MASKLPDRGRTRHMWSTQQANDQSGYISREGCGKSAGGGLLLIEVHASLETPVDGSVNFFFKIQALIEARSNDVVIEADGAPTGMFMQAIEEWDMQRLDVPGRQAAGDGGASVRVRSSPGVRSNSEKIVMIRGVAYGGIVSPFGVVLRSQWRRRPKTTLTQFIQS